MRCILDMYVFQAGGLVLLAAVVLCVVCSCSSAGEVKYHTVTHVIDGDTVCMDNGIKFRYRAVNAPEIAHEGKPGEPMGLEALIRNRQLVHGRKVRIVQDSDRVDRFGRMLGYLYLPDGRMVNEILVREGLAFVCLYGRTSGYRRSLLAAQRNAIEKKLGIWSLPPSRPEIYYLGNCRSLRFHRPWCPNGRKTRKSNRIIFKTREDAFKEGYCPCRKCRP